MVADKIGTPSCVELSYVIYTAVSAPLAWSVVSGDNAQQLLCPVLRQGYSIEVSQYHRCTCVREVDVWSIIDQCYSISTIDQ